MDPVLIVSGAIIVATAGYAFAGTNPERGYIPEFLERARQEVPPPRRFRGLFKIINPINEYRYRERVGRKTGDLLFQAMHENAVAVTKAVQQERRQDMADGRYIRSEWDDDDC